MYRGAMRARYTILALVALSLSGCGPSQEEIRDSCKGSADPQKCVDQNNGQIGKDAAGQVNPPKP